MIYALFIFAHVLVLIESVDKVDMVIFIFTIGAETWKIRFNTYLSLLLIWKEKKKDYLILI